MQRLSQSSDGVDSWSRCSLISLISRITTRASRCHRQQFFTRQATIGTGPAICTVCHLRAAPREDRRFAFGKPNSANQTAKPKDERQFKIEFPHDKHQNVIARWHRLQSESLKSHHRLKSVPQDKKPDYNNCSLCHVTDKFWRSHALVSARC